MLSNVPLQSILWGLGGAAAGLFVVVLILLIRIRRLPITTPFEGKQSPGGRTLSQVLPDDIPGFSRAEKLPYFTGETRHEVSYRGAGASIQLTAVKADSSAAALSVVKGTRRGRTRNTFVATNFRADVPYVFKNTETERLVAWANGGWAFVARSADRLALEQFVESFPY